MSPSSEGSYGPEYNPLRPLPCLLLKPISAHHAYCPIGSAYRPTRASVLSGHIDSVTVATIICHAPQQKLLRVTLPGLPFTARPTVSGRSYRPYSHSHAPYVCFSLLLTKVQNPFSLLPFYLLCPSSKYPALPVSVLVYIVRQFEPCNRSSRLSSGLPLQRSSSVLYIRRSV